MRIAPIILIIFFSSCYINKPGNHGRCHILITGILLKEPERDMLGWKLTLRTDEGTIILTHARNNHYKVGHCYQIKF